MTTQDERGSAADAPGEPDIPGLELHPLRTWLPIDEVDMATRVVLPDFEPVRRAAEAANIALSVQWLPFYARGTWLVRAWPVGAPESAAAYAFWSDGGFHALDGTSAPVHDANVREDILLEDDNVLLYAAFFCRYVHGNDGPFWPVAHPDDLNDGGPRDAAAPPAPRPESVIAPPTVARRAEGDGWTVGLCVQYGDALFRATFAVKPDGLIDMEADEPLAAGVPYDRARNAPPPEWRAGADGIELAGHSSPAPRHPSQRAVQRTVGEAMARLQLLRALRAGEAGALFTPKSTDDEGLLAEFAAFVVDSAALVLIESRTDYIERLVADLLVAHYGRPVRIQRSTYSQVPEPGVQVPDVVNRDLLLLSLHESARVRRPQAVAFVLGSTDAAALVGCRSRADVPESLRQIADLVLDLGSLDGAAFRDLFCEVFDCPWPAGHDVSAAAWLPYFEPADLQRALRDRAFRDGATPGAAWQAGDALAAIEARALERLARYLPDESRRLGDLVGLGEARQVVQDLLADFMAALEGRVAWNEVDRGMLLVGPPGTGKTMLARVLAQESGIRFVSASIAGWMTGDANLGAVIEAMRQTFTDARQYAPCILFLDEIDSLGNRQKFGGHNLGWDTGFLTAVLAEMQGFDETRGVFVIGATNHEDQVDPALRRAGRLDQVVRLDYPQVEEVPRILDQYLAPYRAAGRLAPDVDPAAVGAAMVGHSGAEVEQFVRDAARRARRDGGPIATRHLLAAATGAPRHPAAGMAVTPAELERTAWHEAGHAVAQLTGRLVGGELAVISIVPRANGSLGYAGFLPGDSTGWTAAHYREHVETMLAGRAAEELRYGAAEVSGGAGGPADSCDLAMATATVTRMACEAALGRERRLAWRPRAAGPEDVAAIRATLDEAYAGILARLRTHRPLLEALARALVDSRQMLGSEVRALARAHGVAGRGGHAPGGPGAAP
jgi:AAA+ superfamily predicted ATPase